MRVGGHLTGVVLALRPHDPKIEKRVLGPQSRKETKVLGKRLQQVEINSFSTLFERFSPFFDPGRDVPGTLF